MNIFLFELDEKLKKFLLTFVIVLTIGVCTGLVFVNQTTNFSPDDAVERFNGSQQNQDEQDDFDVQENYPKSLHEMLMTTHNHIIGFSLIFFAIGIIFYFNSIVKGFWKSFLMIEPLISAVISFSSIWGMRFIDKNFVYITVISATLMYISYFIMAFIIIYELLFKKVKAKK